MSTGFGGALDGSGNGFSAQETPDPEPEGVWRLSGPGHRKKHALAGGHFRQVNRVTGLVAGMHDPGMDLPFPVGAFGLPRCTCAGKPCDRSLRACVSDAKSCVAVERSRKRERAMRKP